MKVLITADFYSEFELYETKSLERLENYAASMVLGSPANIDEAQHKLIGDQDTISTQDAIQQADKVIYISDIAEAMGL